MKSRCLNPNHKQFKNWGGRGIKIYQPWIDRFEAFLDYVLTHLGPRPSPKHSLDRWPNKHGNYEPGNIRWATAKQQNNNTSRNYEITLPDDHVVSLTQLERDLGLRNEALHNVVSNAKRSISHGANPTEVRSKIAIDITLWLAVTGLLKDGQGHHRVFNGVLNRVRAKAT
jgi:hypothetical protein